MRLFFALEPPPAARAALAVLADALAEPCGGRAVPRGNLHLTLVFVGEVDPARVDALCAVGEAAGAAAAPFAVTLDRVGRFARAQVGWAAPEFAPPALQALHEALRDGCAAAGFRMEDRPYAPHVTLVRKARRDASAPPVFAPIVMRARTFALMSSTQGPAGRGVVYRAVARFGIGGGA
jgi:2'-5' RNA ligase